MEEAFAAIQIEDEEYGGLSYENDNEDLSEMEMRWCLIGRFLTDSHIDFQVMQHKMASLGGQREERLKDGDNPRSIEINKIDLWVQLHGMSTGFMSQRVVLEMNTTRN
ncbi:hypothetical protein POM88_027887 [Heracleum sosnowskyi]|uniref:Uncharacterized protein n=1 Tax=Heracleum sosnowskyi TaxID=360622 RepID=A0AAD8I9E1_9APIA|nr:hypothetical protein POM88_027887 [Heracleum sosnowskyi]